MAAEIQSYIKQAQGMLSGLSVKEIPFPKIGAAATKAAAAATPQKRRKMSVTARQAISDAQKKRWAAQKAKNSGKATKA